jgi:two-component system sensor histidine kinase KdpD
MRGESRRSLRYGASIAVVALCTLLCAFMNNLYDRVEPTNLVMVYLLGVVILAGRLGRGPAIVASLLSVLAFDYFFVPPRLSFAVNDTQYLFTFLVMLAVVLIISTLTVRLRDVARKTQLREHRTASLHALTRKLAVTRGQEAILQATAQHIAELFDSEVVALLPDDSKMLRVCASQPPEQTLDFKERSVAQWGYDMRELAGRGTDTVPSADRLYIPLLSPRGSFGSLGLKSADPLRLMIPEQLQLLEALAQQAALALEVDRLTEEAGKQNVLIETERLRNALLSSVSHDLRTPLAAITGSASSLLDTGNPLPESSRQEILQTIYDEAERLNDQVNNLLEMTRLESGNLNVRKELQPLEETIGSACQRLERFLRDRLIRIDIPSDLPLVFADGVLLEKVFLNLLDNAIKYTPPGSPIEIAARRQDMEILVEVRDNGPGLGKGEEEKIFDKFHRGARQSKPGGAGLGLTICRGIIRAHGGKIWAENRAEGGAVFRFTLPLPPDADADGHGLQAESGEMKR